MLDNLSQQVKEFVGHFHASNYEWWFTASDKHYNLCSWEWLLLTTDWYGVCSYTEFAKILI